MADEAKLIAVVEANTKQIENAMKRLVPIIKGSTDQMTASVKKLDQQVGVVGASFAKIGKLATWTAAIGAAKQLASSMIATTKSVADLVDAADKIGISATKLEALRYAAEQSGIGAEQLDSALSKLSKGLAEARNGSGDLFKLLRANGMNEVQIKALSLTEAFAKVADITRDAKDATDANKISTLAFGRGLDEMVNLTNQGAAGVKKLTDEFMKLGPTTDEAKRKSAEYDDQLARSMKQWDIAVEKMTAIALTSLTEIGRVEHEVFDAIMRTIAAAEAAGDYFRKNAPPNQAGAAAAGAAAGAQMGTGAGPRINRVPPIPPADPATAAAVAAAAARAAAGAAAVPGTPSVVPPSGAGGGVHKPKAAGSGMTTVSTSGGLQYTVASAYAPQFQGLIDDLEARGYVITGGRGYRPGATVNHTGRPSQHRYGKAIDINPALNPQSPGVGPGMVTNLPPGMAELAARWGMRWGGTFGRKDPMHFDVMGKAPMGEEALNTAKGLSNEAQKLADNLQKAGEEFETMDDASKQTQDAITNMNQAFKRDMLGGFIRDLEHGVKPAEAFANALQKIADLLLDRALNAIFPDVASAAAGAVFAGGGVMTSRGPMPLRRYAGGGVAHSPQVAMFGEGGRPEAFVPLPDGRRIPVNIRVPGMGGLGNGRGGQAVAVHNRVTVDPSPLFVTTTHAIARQGGRDAVVEAGDQSRRRPGGR